MLCLSYKSCCVLCSQTHDLESQISLRVLSFPGVFAGFMKTVAKERISFHYISFVKDMNINSALIFLYYANMVESIRPWKNNVCSPCLGSKPKKFKIYLYYIAIPWFTANFKWIVQRKLEKNVKSYSRFWNMQLHKLYICIDFLCFIY